MKTIKKILFTMILALLTINVNANNVTNNSVLNTISDSIEKCIVNVPSYIKVFESEDDNIHIRFRSTDKILLKNVNYNIYNNSIYINSLKNYDYINDNKIVIYLYIPKTKDIEFLTDKRSLNLIASNTKKSKSVKNENN